MLPSLNLQRQLPGSFRPLPTKCPLCSTAQIPSRRKRPLNFTPSKRSTFIGSPFLTTSPTFQSKFCEGNYARGALQTRSAIFGVGAPEAILVGIVALLVFGPKGLADAAKSLGKTLRSFQPTIREIAEVSTDLRSTLEQEIGLDEIRDEFRTLQNPPPPVPKPRASNSEGSPSSPQAVDDEMAKSLDPDIDAKRQQAAQMAWGGESPSEAVQDVPQPGNVPQTLDALSGLSIEQLEAELQKRKKGGGEVKDSEDA